MEQLSLIPIDAEILKPVDYWVTKANALVEANYRLSLLQQKIIITMASLIQPDDEDFKWYRLHVNHFIEILGINNHNIYREMVVSVHNLMERVVTIYIGNQEYLKTHWIQSAKYRVGGGYVDVEFDPKLKPFFLHLKNKFTTYRLQNVIRLRSVYSIRIYELLKQYQTVGKRTITIESLRKMLGIEPKEYKTYNNLKRKVIVVAHNEINEKTDISFDFKEIKIIRKVNEIEFTITKKVPAEQKPEAPKKVRQKVKEDKRKEQMRQRVEEYLQNLTPEDLAELRQEAEVRARKEGAVMYRDRDIPEHIIRGYISELVGERVKVQSGVALT